MPVENHVLCPRCRVRHSTSGKLFIDCACGQRIIVIPADESEWLRDVVEDAHK